MAQPTPTQPDLPNGFDNQTSVIMQMYNLALRVAISRTDLDLTWLVLAQEEDRVQNEQRERH